MTRHGRGAGTRAGMLAPVVGMLGLLLPLTVAGTMAGAASPSPPVMTNPAGWPTEQQAGTGNADDSPVAARLTVYLRLLSPAGGTADEYANFLTESPDWPKRSVMIARFERALSQESDPATLSRLCGRWQLTTAQALAHCADAAVPPPPRIGEWARAAWIAGADQPGDARLLSQRFGALFTADDEWRRFERQERAGHLGAADQQVAMLDTQYQALARARLALRRNDANAETLLAGVPAGQRNDAMLVLDHLRWLDHAQRLDEAVALWKRTGFATEQHQDGPTAALFWRARDALARDLLAQGRNRDALDIADDRSSLPEVSNYDARFLTGWILLQRLHQPARALAQFEPLTKATALITRSRGLYWSGRAQEARHNRAAARESWGMAAELANTFYGQMSIAALQGNATSGLLAPSQAGQPVREYLMRLRTPEPTVEEAVRFDTSDMARAAQILVSWNDFQHARDFVIQLDIQATRPVEHVLAARLATRLALPDVAVLIARRAGRDGIALVDDGWPRPYVPAEHDLPQGLELAVMRQESSFDPAIVSGAHAVGLMQLRPATGQELARRTHQPFGNVTAATLTNPQVNMTLGALYLQQLMERFGGSVPYLLAAYNSGPHRVDTWLASLGDPVRDHPSSEAVLDWIESIPFEETRNYVERVEENMAVYQAREAQREAAR
ncbi:lytic transglycosylase domain-containing protein [Novacetimonas cocois]|nr:lytic transglycosylase domain-containing protein [Novacetimonas cocois]